jgi:hypothetical protein
MVRVKHHKMANLSTNSARVSFEINEIEAGKIYMHRSNTMWIARKFSQKFPGYFTFYNLVKTKKFAIPVKDLIAQIPNENVLIPYFQERKEMMLQLEHDSFADESAEFINIHFITSVSGNATDAKNYSYIGSAQVKHWGSEHLTLDLFDQPLVHYGYAEYTRGRTDVKVRYEDIGSIESIAGIEKWTTDEKRQCDCPECERLDFLEQQRERELQETLEREWVIIENERKRKREDEVEVETVRRSERIRNRPVANYKY